MRGSKRLKKALLLAERHGLNVPETGEWIYERPYAMSKAELAEKMKYKGSKELFQNHVHNNKKLMKLLSRTDYNKRAKKLTQKQVDIICATVGRPIIKEKYDEYEDLE